MVFSHALIFSAVAVNAQLQYAVVEVQTHSETLSVENKKRRLGNVLKEEKKLFLVVASDLVQTLEAKWGVKLIVRKTLLGSDLENCRLLMVLET